MTALVRTTVGAVLAALLLGATGSAQAQESDVPGDRDAIERVASCARETGRLLVLFVIDESGSLRTNDPEAARVAAAKAALRSLALVSSNGENRGVQVETALSSFGATFEVVAPWTTVTDATLPGLLAQADRFATLNEGIDTDFAAAFLGAHAEIARYAAESGGAAVGSPCKMLLLFTDGSYDIEVRNTPARVAEGVEKDYAPGIRLDQTDGPDRLEAFGRDLLCRGDGVVDQIREEDVAVVTVALEEFILPDDRSFLHALSTGEAGAVTCGNDRRPDAGAYLPAANVAQLLAGFDRVANEMAGGTLAGPESFAVCPEQRCAQGTLEFELNAAYEQFHLLGNTGAEGIVVELRSPESSEPLVLDPGTRGSLRLGSVALEVARLSPLDLTIDGTLPAGDDSWEGTWSVTFIDPTGANGEAVASAQLFLFGAFSPDLLEVPVFRRGEEASFQVHVVDAAGSPRTPADLVRSATLSASITNPVTERVQTLAVTGPDGDGLYTATYAVPAEMEAAAVNLGLRLDVVSQTGVALQPRSSTYAITVEPPVTYPSVGPALVRLSNLSGRDGEALGTITVTGGAEGDGCVWFDGATFQQLPRGADGLAPSFTPTAGSQTECIPIASGERRDVEFRVRVEEVASGSVEGRIQARLASDADPAVLPAELPFEFAMYRPVDQFRRIIFVAGFLLLGVLVPWAVLWLLNWWTARFEPVGVLRHTALPVRVTPDGVLTRTDSGGRPFMLEPKDFGNCSGPLTPQRRFEAAGLRFRPHVPVNPFAAAVGAVTGPTHTCGSLGARRHGGVLTGKSRFSLAREWVFVATGWSSPDDDSAPEVTGTLHAFLPEGPVTQTGPPLVDEIVRTVPDAAHRLAMAAAKLQRPTADPAPVPAGDGPLLDEPVGWKPPAPGARPPHAPPASPTPAGDPALEDEKVWRPPPRR